MAMGFTIGAAAAAQPADGPASLVGALDPSLWLCGPNSDRLPFAAESQGDAAADGAFGACYWCQAFGSIPGLDTAPAAVPGFTIPGLPNQPFTETAPHAHVARLTGFRSRAPPL